MDINGPGDQGTRDEPLVSPRFPRSARYHPDWLLANASGARILSG